MSEDKQGTAGFSGLIDLAAETLGGTVKSCTDDFFAGAENLLKPGRGEFIADKFTERGKWMDGWESRRKRATGHDRCVIQLGVRGHIRALDIDTNHFLGNHPPFASVDAADGDGSWTEILAQSPLRPGSQNLFTVTDAGPFTRVRLNIYPDGGVARFRVYGDVEPAAEEGEIDLVAVANGGKALACSDAFFGPMDNLLLPKRAENMGGGWETRRKRPAPGNDWILIRLGAPGMIERVEIDTHHFKGNFPDRCALRGVNEPNGKLTQLVEPEHAFETVLEPTSLKAHQRHLFEVERLSAKGPFTHVRLDIYPDGGISRLRLFGRRAE